MHEMYHAYQDVCVNGEDVNPEQLYPETTMEQWAYEFQNYKSTNGWNYEKSYEEYKSQSLEQTADQYASVRIREYMF